MREEQRHEIPTTTTKKKIPTKAGSDNHIFMKTEESLSFKDVTGTLLLETKAYT